jgi:adenylate cyclase class 2
MAIEIEKKYHLRDGESERVATKLGELGAEFIGEVFEQNLVYRVVSGGNRPAILRIRKIGDSAILTYKEDMANADSAAGLKQKIEHETAVADAEAAENIVESLGHRLSLVYEKRRKTFRIADAEVVLDELPFGSFMEIEGSPENIAAAEKLLDAQDLMPEPQSYPALTVRFGCEKNGVFEARFGQ